MFKIYLKDSYGFCELRSCEDLDTAEACKEWAYTNAEYLWQERDASQVFFIDEENLRIHKVEIELTYTVK